jgi:hypothetical protein
VDEPDTRYYAVNDRPVAVVAMADGGADCLVFDFATGELVPDRAYFEYLIPGAGKDTDVLTKAEFEARLDACRAAAGGLAAEQVRTWAERLAVAAGSAAAVAVAVGFTSAVPGRYGVAADPPPAGYDKVTIASGATSRTMTLRPHGRLLTTDILAAVLGPGRELPILPDSFDEGLLAYRVTAECDISARIRRGAACELFIRWASRA